jgi:hypothetical protein
MDRSLLLTSAALFLLGTWAAMWFSALPDAQADQPGQQPTTFESYQQSCARGDATACNNLGVSYHRGYGSARDDEAARELFERACSAGNAEACNNQAALTEQRALGAEGQPVRELYERSCEGGSALGCSNLGALYAKGKGVRRDKAAARRLFERACLAAVPTACRNLAALDQATLRLSETH